MDVGSGVDEPHDGRKKNADRSCEDDDGLASIRYAASDESAHSQTQLDHQRGEYR